MQIVTGMANNDPRLRTGLDIMRRQGSKGIERYARNMCRERGVDPDEMLRMMGLK